jgi:dTMP kinase
MKKEKFKKSKKGKFIVIDGIDGSGKATQTELLLKRLTKDGHKVKKIDFPRYNDNFFGALVGECLTGKYGNFIEIHPRIASVIYAADRWESSEVIKKWLDQGYVVVADRYVSSNQIHQGGKIKDENDRVAFLEWLDRMEHGTFKIPRPDMIVFLHLPVTLSKALIDKRKLEAGKEGRKYMEGKKDIAEEDVKHLADSRASAMKIVEKVNKWKLVECSENNEILPREKIHEMVYATVKKAIK